MCVICILLFQAAGEAGDGYRARRSPHTPHERFEGLTVLKAMQVSGSVSLPRPWLSRKSVCHLSIFLCGLRSGWGHGCAIFLTSTCAVSPDPLPPRSCLGTVYLEGLSTAFSPVRQGFRIATCPCTSVLTDMLSLELENKLRWKEPLEISSPTPCTQHD